MYVLARLQLSLLVLVHFVRSLHAADQDFTVNIVPTGATYARILRTSFNGPKLLATWENASPEPKYFPIYQSLDGGHSWNNISEVRDTVNGWGLRFQPMLYRLPKAFAGFAPGDILCAGVSSPPDQSATRIDIYASRDQGFTWTFVVNVAVGGRAFPTNGETPVWEPFLVLYHDTLIVYYSDQRDPKYGQKLVYQSTKDLFVWTIVYDIVTSSVYADRPGMPVVAQMENKQWILTYEFCCSVEPKFRVRYKIADDPRHFDRVEQMDLTPNKGKIPKSAPYVFATNGKVFVSAASSSDVFVNKENGDSKAWKRIETNSPAAYSRSMTSDGSHTTLFLLSAGFPNGQVGNAVVFATKDI